VTFAAAAFAYLVRSGRSSFRARVDGPDPAGVSRGPVPDRVWVSPRDRFTWSVSNFSGTPLRIDTILEFDGGHVGEPQTVAIPATETSYAVFHVERALLKVGPAPKGDCRGAGFRGAGFDLGRLVVQLGRPRVRHVGLLLEACPKSREKREVAPGRHDASVSPASEARDARWLTSRARLAAARTSDSR
jgi:hypothetical protein